MGLVKPTYIEKLEGYDWKTSLLYGLNIASRSGVKEVVVTDKNMGLTSSTQRDKMRSLLHEWKNLGYIDMPPVSEVHFWARRVFIQPQGRFYFTSLSSPIPSTKNKTTNRATPSRLISKEFGFNEYGEKVLLETIEFERFRYDSPELLRRTKSILNKTSKLLNSKGIRVGDIKNLQPRNNETPEQFASRKFQILFYQTYGVLPSSFTEFRRTFHKEKRNEKPKGGGLSLYKNHGRIYSKLSNMPKEARRALTIGNEPVVELDYSSAQLAIAYNSVGLELPSGLNFKKLIHRCPKTAKAITTYFCGSSMQKENGSTKTDKEWFSNLNSSLRKRELWTLSEGEQTKLEELLKPVWHLRGDFWERATRIESDIAMLVLNKLNQLDIPCIPVHDSFVVPVSNQTELLDAMQTSWYDTLGFYPYIKVETKEGKTTLPLDKPEEEPKLVLLKEEPQPKTKENKMNNEEEVFENFLKEVKKEKQQQLKLEVKEAVLNQTKTLKVEDSIKLLDSAFGAKEEPEQTLDSAFFNLFKSDKNQRRTK